MQDIMQVLNIVLPLVISLGIGFFSRKTKLFSPEAIEGMKSFVMKIALPAMIFGLFFTADYSVSVLYYAGTMFVLGFVGLGLGFLLARPFDKKHPMLKFMTSGWEVGMLGYALFALLYGSENLRYMALLDFGQVLFVFTAYVAALNARRGCSAKESFLMLLKNPIPWAIIAGAGLSLLGVSRALEPSGTTAVVQSICNFLAQPLSCLIFVVVGYGIEFSKKGLSAAFLSVALRTLVCGGLCALALWFLGTIMPLSDPMRWAAIIIFLTPAPYILSLFTENEIEQAEVSISLSLQTLFSIAAFIGIVVFWH